MAATCKDCPELPKATLELARGRNYEVIVRSTIQAHTDGEGFVVQTETNRRKYKNIQRALNATLRLRNEDNSYQYAEVGGEAVERVMGQEARDHIDKLSQTYYG